MALVVGGNAYISVEDASAYLGGSLSTAAWDAATPDERERALIQATRQIDRLPLRGAPAEEGQALGFPRRQITGYGWAVQSAVPQAVLDAVCEQAAWLLTLTNYDHERLREHSLGVIGGSLGEANEYSDTTLVRRNQSREPLCPAARQLLAPFIARTLPL